jgi:hypothetical protein
MVIVVLCVAQYASVITSSVLFLCERFVEYWKRFQRELRMRALDDFNQEPASPLAEFEDRFSASWSSDPCEPAPGTPADIIPLAGGMLSPQRLTGIQ